jgi:recombination protein RecA
MRNMEDPDRVYYAEDVMFNIIELIKSGIKVIVLDSVANLIPKARMEADSEQQFMALLPRLLSDNLGKIAQWAGVKDALVVFVNQIREKPGVMWGNPLTTPGGRALKHNASLRIEINKRFSSDSIIFIEDEKAPEGKKLIGRYSIVKLEKNRFAKPLIDSNGRPVGINIPIYYEPYFPNIEEIIFDAGRQHKVIKIREGIFSWEDKKGNKHKAEGKKAFIELLKKEKLIDELTEDIKTVSKESGNPLPPEMLQYNLAKDKDVKIIKVAEEKKDTKEDIKVENEEDDLPDIQ